MKFQFENLGLLDKAEIELADLTIICGENNTGKTYATYAIYGFLRSWRKIFHSVLKQEIKNILHENDRYQINLQQLFDGKLSDYLERVCKSYTDQLHQVFATKPPTFAKTSVKINSPENIDFSRDYQSQVKAGANGKVITTISKKRESHVLDILVTDDGLLQGQIIGLLDFISDAIADIVFSPHLPEVHISSAERTGAAIFRNELDIARTRMLSALQQIGSKELKRNPLRLLQEMGTTGYPWPVEDNVDFLRNLEELDKHTGKLAGEHPEIITFFDEMLGGSYKVVKEQLVFQSKGAGKQRFTMNESSSCIRALLDVGFYLRCKAKPGELFIIDEPELNLHPKNQRAFARLVARLVNAGVKVLMTTHSDYIVKEINTLIMLHQKTEHTRNAQKKYGYDDTELLNPSCIRLYTTDMVLSDNPKGGRRIRSRTLTPATIHPERGIEVPTFDDTIEEMNTIQTEILFGDGF